MEIAEQMFLRSLFWRTRSREEKRELAIEFDCLVPNNGESDYTQSDVAIELAKDINSLHQRFRVIFFSLDCFMDYQVAVKWLLKERIEFDDFVLFKPKCDVVIDHERVKLNGWKAILETIMRDNRWNQ